MNLNPVVALGCVFSALVFAPAVRADPLVPYSGTLEQNGTPATGTFSMTFELHSALTGGALLYQQTQDVDAAAGQFSVAIGPIPPAVFSARPYLAVVVDGNALAGRTALHPAPFAVAAEPGIAFEADSVNTPLVSTDLVSAVQVNTDGLAASQLFFPLTVGTKIGLYGDLYTVGIRSNETRFRGGDGNGFFSFGEQSDGAERLRIRNDGTVSKTRLTAVIPYGVYNSNRSGSMFYEGGRLLFRATASGFRSGVGLMSHNVTVSGGGVSRVLSLQRYSNESLSHKVVIGSLVVGAGVFPSNINLSVTLTRGPGVASDVNDFSEVIATELPAN